MQLNYHVNNVQARSDLGEAQPPPGHRLPTAEELQQQTAVTELLHREIQVLLRAPCHQGQGP